MDTCHVTDLFWIFVFSAFRIITSYPVRCVWRSSVSATLPETQTVAPLSECIEGELYWNNPRGMLTTIFTQDGINKDFILCLVVTSGNHTLAFVYDVSSENPVQLEDVFSEANPACVESVNKQVKIRFDATNDLETLATIEYFKQPP